MSSNTRRRRSLQTQDVEFPPSYPLQNLLPSLENGQRPDERSPRRYQCNETAIPVLLRSGQEGSNFSSPEENYGHWILRPSLPKEDDEQSEAWDPEDEDEAELSDDEGFWNMARAAHIHHPGPTQQGQNLANRVGGVFGGLAAAARDNLPSLSRPQTEQLVFDDENVVMVYDTEEERESENPIFDFTVPFGPRQHESYRFEIENPTAAPAIRYINGMSTARHLAALGRGIHHHALASFNTLSGAYDRLTGTYGTPAENIQPALRMGRAVASDVVEGAIELGNVAQEQWREWSPWFDRMLEVTMTAPTHSRRGGFGR